ncbi:MAG: hypothetical protein HZA19_06825 [Nitrospirae bacterium]|nr:hypothetical protein [Nitrospirota bacterium]
MMTETKFQHPKILLQEGLRRKSLAGTYLFHGSLKEERIQTALSVARSLNCLKPDPDANLGGCGVCLSCKKITAGNHPDVRVVHPDGDEITIDRVREIQRDMAYHPLEGKKKVYILMDSDRMNPQTANAFLKALEEPPADVHFILLADRLHTMLPTLLSRCQKILFHERIGGTDFTGTGRWDDAAGDLSTVIPAETVYRYVDAGFEGFSRIFDLAEKLAKTDGAFEAFLRFLETYLRDCLIREATTDVTLLSYHENQKGPVPFSTDGILALTEFIHTIQKGLERNVNRRLALESLLMRWETSHIQGRSS